MTEANDCFVYQTVPGKSGIGFHPLIKKKSCFNFPTRSAWSKRGSAVSRGSSVSRAGQLFRAGRLRLAAVIGGWFTRCCPNRLDEYRLNGAGVRTSSTKPAMALTSPSVDAAPRIPSHWRGVFSMLNAFLLKFTTRRVLSSVYTVRSDATIRTPLSMDFQTVPWAKSAASTVRRVYYINMAL